MLNIQFAVQNFNFVIKLEIESCQVEDFNLKGRPEDDLIIGAVPTAVQTVAALVL